MTLEQLLMRLLDFIVCTPGWMASPRHACSHVRLGPYTVELIVFPRPGHFPILQDYFYPLSLSSDLTPPATRISLILRFSYFR